jgi:hypothetical protein
MTKLEFEKLEPFDEEKYKNGDKVVVLYGGEVVFPDDQDYYEGHPEPVVLVIDGESFSYNPDYAKNVIRMIRKDRYAAHLKYNDGLAVGVVWTVWDAEEQKTIASFLKASEEAQEFAEEYAQFLNDVEQVLREKKFDPWQHTYTFVDTSKVSTTTFPPVETWGPYLQAKGLTQYQDQCNQGSLI